MEHQQNNQRPLELCSQLVCLMTTEHDNLQSGRSLTTAETNGRSSLFVGAVSSGLIALTFERVLQAGSVDVIYARGINRIRHLYLEYAPQMQPDCILSTHDDQEGTLGTEAMHTSWWQVFLNTAGMMAVITSVLAGSFVGLLLTAFTCPWWVTTSAGVVTFLLSMALLQRSQWRQWMRQARTMPVLFPSPPRP